MSTSCSAPPAGGQVHVVATSTDAIYTWLTPWMLAPGASNAKCTLKRRAVTGNLQCQVAYQTAAVRTDKPDDPATIGAAQSGAGEYCTGKVDISAGTASKTWIRFGVAASLTQAGSPGQADVSLDSATDACGQLVGTTTVSPVTYSTTNGFVPVTGWLPALAVEKLRATIVISGLVGNFQCRLAYRVATTSKETPGAWSTTFDAWRTADGEYNTGDLTPTTGSDMWVQVGLQFANSSGTAVGQATVTSAVHARKG